MTATIELQQAQVEIRRCTRCVDRGFIPEANPILRGNADARIMVIGQAPGPTAAERPIPFSGASGKKLQEWISRAGFSEGSLHDPDRFYLTSLTKCFPGRSQSGKGDRAPSRTEIELCRPNLDAELRLIQPELILALGRLAISTLVPSLKNQTLDKIIGTAWAAEYKAANAATVLPLPHPSGVSRWSNLPENQQRLARALEWLGTWREQRDL